MSVIVTRKIGDAIDLMRAKGLKNSEIVENHTEHNHLRVDGWDSVQQLDIGELCDALYLGYEVEETPEERIKRAYLDRVERSKVSTSKSESARYLHFADGIKYTLNELGICIKEVNA